MSDTRLSHFVLLLVLITAGPVAASDDSELNDIYRQFFRSPVNVEETRVQNANGESMEQLQKFSWVFVRVDESWRVITDFDATTAPLEVLDSIEAEFRID